MRTKNTFEQWILNRFKRSEVAGLCQYGACAYFSGLTSYSDTTRLYNRYHTDIWAMLYDDYRNRGLDSCIEVIIDHVGVREVYSDVQYKHLLVWYAAERIAREITKAMPGLWSE